jgi:hypothetical protein
MNTSAQRHFSDIPNVPPRAAESRRVLSIGQQRLWYLSQLAPTSGVYNVPYSSRLHGVLDISAFEKALNAVVGRHEVLRTVILAPGGRPVPVPLKKWSLELKKIDIRDLPRELSEIEANRICYEESARPFNLARDLMLRCTLIQIADEEYVFHHVAPHLAFEGGSVGVLFRDLSCFYSSFLYGRPAELPEMRLQYCDFALWQQELLQGERLDSLMSYWREQLVDAPQISLPIDLPRPAIHTLRGARLPLALSREWDNVLPRSQRSAKRVSVRLYRADGLLHWLAFLAALHRN